MGIRGTVSDASVVDDFLTHLEKERDVSPHTLTAYRRDLEEFVAFLKSEAQRWSDLIKTVGIRVD